MNPSSLSVFFPAFNEEENIRSTVEKAIKVIKNLNIKEWEIIIVDDGSKDGTGEIADKLSKEHKQVRVIHQENGGYGSALKTGFSNSKFEWIVYTDSDGQFDFGEVVRFFEKAKDADVVLGYRIKRSDPFIRIMLAWGWRLSVLVFLGLRLRDVDCGFKLLNRKVWRKISPLDSQRGAMVNAEIAIRAKKSGFKILQVGVNHYPRILGKPTGASIRVIINSYLDLIKLRFKLHYEMA